MFIVLIRTFLLYLLVVFSMRVMGKRQIGQLQPYELVIAIMISDLASLPMQDTRIPLIHGIIPIITLLVSQVILSLLQIKSEKIRKILDGRPSIIIKKGKFQIPSLKAQIYSVHDLMEELRINGYFNINEIEYAILETNGQISVISKTKLDPATKEDLNIKTTQQAIPLIVIHEGKIEHANLDFLKKTEQWLNDQLKKGKVENIEDIFIAFLDSNNNFVFQYKDNTKKKEVEVDL